MAQLTQEQLTLNIEGYRSTCGNCGQEADFHESSHRMGGKGCGVTWLYVTTPYFSPSGETGRGVAALRPDLEFVR